MFVMMFIQRVSGNWFSGIFRRPRLADQLGEPAGRVARQQRRPWHDAVQLARWRASPAASPSRWRPGSDPAPAAAARACTGHAVTISTVRRPAGQV